MRAALLGRTRLAGVSIGSRLPAAVVQRVFAGVIVVVAVYVVFRAVSGG